MVAHRLSTAAKCDRIVVLDQGRIVESGTHAELLAIGHSGKYASLWASQRHQDTKEDLDGAASSSV